MMSEAEIIPLGPEHALGGRDVEHLDAVRQLDKELRVAREVMNAPRVLAGKTRHRLHALPVGDRDELGLAGAVLVQELDAQRFLLERTDAVLVEIGRILDRLGGGRAAAPYAGDLRCRAVRSRAHDALLTRLGLPFVPGPSSVLTRPLGATAR